MALTDCISASFAISLAILSLTCILVSIWWKNRNLPPGPWGIPFFGYYPFLSQKPYFDFSRLAETYGKVFSFRSTGGTLFVVLNGMKVAKEVLVRRADEFTGKPFESNFLDWLSDGLGVSQEEGSGWIEHRQFFLRAAKNFGFGRLEIEGDIQNEIMVLKEELRKSKQQPVDLSPHTDYIVSTVIMKIMFARKIEKHDVLFQKLSNAVHKLVDVMADHRFMLVGIPFQLSLYLLPWSVEVRRGRSFLKSTVKDIIDEHVRTFDPHNLRDYVDSYLFEMEKMKKSEKLDKSSFTMERLLAISMNMTMEGTESVGDTICCLLVQASRHPEEQKKVQEELDSVIGKEALPSFQDRKRLPYLEAFIQELYRTTPAFPLTNLNSNFEETTINGYRIPTRSILVGNLWGINTDPEIFKNPSQFDVTRFLAKDGKRIKTDGPYPFSIGKRACVGQSLAKMEVFIIIASLLQSFTLLSTNQKNVIKAIPRD